jgi:hypothetical protein
MAEDYSYDSYSYSQPMSQPDYSYSIGREYDFTKDDPFALDLVNQLVNFNLFDNFMNDRFQDPWEIIKDGDPSRFFGEHLAISTEDQLLNFKLDDSRPHGRFFVIQFTMPNPDVPGFFAEVDYVPYHDEVSPINEYNEEPEEYTLTGVVSDPIFESNPFLDNNENWKSNGDFDQNYDDVEYDQPSFFIARYPIQYFLFCLGFTLLMALLFLLRRRYMILAKRRYMDELAIREATRAADVTFVISVNDKQDQEFKGIKDSPPSYGDVIENKGTEEVDDMLPKYKDIA